MTTDFTQIVWDAATAADCRRIVQLAVQEDLGRWQDWTTVGLIPSEATGQAAVVARQAGVVAGLPAAQLALAEIDPQVECSALVADGTTVAAGTTVATMAGSARSLLVAERLILNLLGQLSGIATLTQRFVAAVAGTRARIYDTRKTTPGWRRLEKYAVRQGGGHNHRTGLFDGILIKDNHLAMVAGSPQRCTPAEAVRRAREFRATLLAENSTVADPRLIEVEVDTLEQLQEVLPAGPDLVLLDNMTLEQLRQAVCLRDAIAPQIELEASGGVRLETVGDIARTGVERISAGALTHSAVAMDFGLDWELGESKQ
jgi:nicotinate-nucleotide pyrophosphorylase (carboxylating)